MNDKFINYSQCWEDPLVLLEALSVKPQDCVLSITSGGDNTLAIVLAGAKKIDSIDINPAENYLLELKISAALALSYSEYLEFLGVTDSQNRHQLFKKVQATLSREAQVWWTTHTNAIKSGLINCGRFERFTIFFARFVLPFIHTRRTIRTFLNCQTLEKQREFYEKHWNSWRWRFLFKLASSRLILKSFGRQKSLFTYKNLHAISSIYLERLEQHLKSVPIKGNFFLEYRLTGKYGKELPPYMEARNFDSLKHMLKSIEPVISIVSCDILTYLRKIQDDTFSKFNLSDIFEGLSPRDNDAVWQELIRTAKPGAIIVYWNNLVQRTCPSHLSNHIKTDENHLQKLRAKDKIFFYDALYVHTIIK